MLLYLRRFRVIDRMDPPKDRDFQAEVRKSLWEFRMWLHGASAKGAI